MAECGWCDQAAKENVRPLPHDCPNAAPEPLNGYSVEFFKVLLFGTWSWVVTTPDGRRLGPILAPGGWGQREAAERAALRRMEQDAARESLTGMELRARLRRAAS